MPGTQSVADWLSGRDVPATRVHAVYERSGPPATMERLRELARRVGLAGEPHEADDCLVFAEDRRAGILYRASGAFWWGDLARLWNPDYRPTELPDGRAAEIADAYLAEMGVRPAGARLDRVVTCDLERVDGAERAPASTGQSVAVIYRSWLDGLPLLGPGAKTEVFLGEGGEVIGGALFAGTFRRHAEYPARTRANLRRVLGRKLGRPLDTLELRDVQLGCFADSPVLEGRFAQPVYVLTVAAPIETADRGRVMVESATHPIPATTFAPLVAIKGRRTRALAEGRPLELDAVVDGGTPPFALRWSSDVDGPLGEGSSIRLERLSAHGRDGRPLPHTVTVEVVDANGMRDEDHVLVTVKSRRPGPLAPGDARPPERGPGDPWVGVEWCNDYTATGLPNISGTDKSAQGFRQAVAGLPGWTSRFDWGNGAAWEQDFKFATAPGGGTDSAWADNVDLAFFAGHGSPGSFWFGSLVDDAEMRAQDARWGDGALNWVVLHACQTMQNNFAWTVWCDAFRGLHEMFGFHTNTEGSTPPLGSRFAFWSTFFLLPGLSLFDLQAAWGLAATECFDPTWEYAVIYAGQAGTDTHHDHLPGFGPVSPDPPNPTFWAYYKHPC